MESSSRYALLAPMPGQRRADLARMTVVEMIAGLPIQLRRSIACDQGIEIAQHTRFTVETNVPILLLRSVLAVAARHQ